MGFVDYAVEGQVGVITINRPKALNALNSDVLTDLAAVLDGVDLDEIRCLILTGAGEKSFVAGTDIGQMSDLSIAEAKFPSTQNPSILYIEVGNNYLRSLFFF